MILANFPSPLIPTQGFWQIYHVQILHNHPASYRAHLMIKFISNLNSAWQMGEHQWTVKHSLSDLFWINLTGHTLQPDCEIQLFSGLQWLKWVFFQQFYGGINFSFFLVSHLT